MSPNHLIGRVVPSGSGSVLVGRERLLELGAVAVDGDRSEAHVPGVDEDVLDGFDAYTRSQRHGL
jgi:hypothetical protein